MKNVLILIFMTFCSFSYGQKTNNFEIGLISGVSINNTSKKGFSNSLGAQTGLRIKTPMFKSMHIQVRSTLRNMNFETNESYGIYDPFGMPTISYRKINDDYETLDLSLNLGVQMFTYKSFSLDIIVGGGKGKILNLLQYESNRRIQNLTEVFNFSEIGLEFHFILQKNLVLIANTQYFYTSFYKLEYGANNSYQLNINLSYAFSLKADNEK